jgi:hypothetical protein
MRELRNSTKKGGKIQAMYIRVKAEPDAKREAVECLGENLYRIAVKEPAEENRANQRIVTLLAKELGVPAAALRLVSGHHGPSKRFLLTRGK